MFRYLLFPLAGFFLILWAAFSSGVITREALEGTHGIALLMVTISSMAVRGIHGSDVSKSTVFVVWFTTTAVIIGSYSVIDQSWWVGMLLAITFLIAISIIGFVYAWFRPTSPDYSYGYHHPKWGTCNISTNGRSLHETEKEIRAICREARAELSAKA
ncbi:MAG: hypothetical protein V4682_03805 [Patescibacteria group bacterium]